MTVKVFGLIDQVASSGLVVSACRDVDEEVRNKNVMNVGEKIVGGSELLYTLD